MNRVRALSLALFVAGACGGPQKLGGAGATCFRDDDCEAGMICVAPTVDDIHRVCSNDPTPLISMVEGPEPVATSGAAGAAGMGGAATGGAAAGGTTAATGGDNDAGTDTGGSATAGKPSTGGTAGSAAGGTATAGTGGTATAGMGGTATAGMAGTSTAGTAPEGGAPP